MTANQSASTQPSVHSIDHFALNVPSIEDAERFYRSFGLRVEPVVGHRIELALYAADGHRWARILPAERKSLAYLSFNCFASDFDQLCSRIAVAGADPVIDEDQDGLWFHDPDGNLLQVKIGPKTSPSSKMPSVVSGSPADARGAHTRSESKTVHPRRLSHVLLFTPDVLRALDFYGKALGLRLSDKSQDIIAFTHAPHGSDHHLVAFAKSGARGWHHAAWDVDNVNMVGGGASQMAAAGYTRGWGTGRHVLGSNYFHYVEDPWGSFCEYSADIDFVSSGCHWPAGDFAPEDSLYLWGPQVPENFVTNTEEQA
ncbi:metapyrocatechase [Burkholderia cenocepacia]|uniref:VOC family protein n=1 Tax=Burkholderia cenocepacia TaxID=95486 RepID=UPI000F56781E|nr:VOC family protein [Burkholderia cenocepacia]RQU23029.1 metapyrocatechase [Burkholderia cenocepacia]RQU46489.1 metapyrocatechase [Burkholderia cenocepacia]RQU74092.1 metapyrocatechase [Burkholderia cenocepacia]RQU97055.1 metapyrocatechase [Burkholderia cenocepacia]RQV33652.1 metapyrocatechase [Burkholderia cenocepacia]